jgi:hypothetical protein
MSQRYSRTDFVVNDLVISVDGGSRGGTWMPADDGVELPPWISPIAGVFNKLDLITAVRGAIKEAVELGQFDEVARAFDAGATGGDPIIRSAIYEVGAAVVASAAYAALGGGLTGMPNPDCDGTSMETIPPTATPVVHRGLEIHRMTELPRLRRQLAETVKYVDKISQDLAPKDHEVDELRARLETALRSLDG